MGWRTLFCVLTIALVSKSMAVMTGGRICMEYLGCFDIPEEFTNETYRPVNWLPNHRTEINATFLLYTPQNPKKFQVLVADDDDRLGESFFDPTRYTKIIVHDQVDRYFDGQWTTDMKDELLLKGPNNVLVVDWSTMKNLEYTQAAANARVLGSEIAYFIKYLGKFNMPPSQVHIIGHGLGAHAAGYAGKQLDKLARITGLDPSGPNFDNMPVNVRLDKSDATLVDVIHTDAATKSVGTGIGSVQMLGHVDFFPNGGASLQPGCRSKFTTVYFYENGNKKSFRKYNQCSHQMAVKLFSASVNNHMCSFLSYECLKWDVFEAGHCTWCGDDGEKCNVMGMDVRKPKADQELGLYVKTGSKEGDYCQFHYRVAVLLTKDMDNHRGTGTMHIKIKGRKGSFEAKLADSNIDLNQGSSYTYMVSTGADIGEVVSATFGWVSKWWSIWKPYIYVDTIDIHPISIADAAEREKAKKTLCFGKTSAIFTGVDVDFREKEC